MAQFVDLGGHAIGRGQRVFVIAEAGVNHNGDVRLAHALIDAAADAGADAVKFQTWITEKLCRPGAKKAKYQEASSGGQDQFSMLKSLELAFDSYPALKKHAEERGLVFLSTPDEIDSARFLCEQGVPALKIGSGEVTNLPYLAEVARLGKPVILSTGMATLAEVAHAVDTLRQARPIPIVLLHCVSAYPAPETDMNLRCIATLREAFQVPSGLSDHTTGSMAAVVAVGLGMAILEKHLTLDRSLPGPDHTASADLPQFTELVRSVRRAEAMLGTGVKAAAASEMNTREVVRRTLLYTHNLDAGHLLEPADFEALRCGIPGLSAESALGFYGRRLRHAVTGGNAVSESDLV
jgi:N-acetylneuraminate synthase/N,N'-diacetyllegionaminate synthase